MRFLSSVSIQTRLFAILSLVILVAAVLAVMGIVSAASFHVQVTDLRASAASLEATLRAQADLAREQAATQRAVLSDDVVDWTAAYDHAGQLDAFLASASFNAVDDQEADAVDQVGALRDKYDAALEADLAPTYEGGHDPLAVLGGVSARADPIAAEMQAGLAALASRYADDVSAETGAIEDGIHARATTGYWAVLLLAALLIVGVFAVGQVTEPLHSLTSAVVAFQNGAYRSEMLSALVQRGDELGRLARAVDAMATSITESVQLKDRFLDSASRFIPTQYLEFLAKPAITDVNLGDHVSAEMAVMFSDIRGFTTVSEKMTPHENFDFVNEYLRLVSPVIQEHDGFIVKFLGDGMMAIFPYGVDDAVRAGIEKQQKIQEFNALLARRGHPPVTVGIGIHTGHMMVGMIGEERRLQGDAFSDNVNLTSRVEGLNKYYGTSMIISSDTRGALAQPDAYKMRALGQARVKGREAPLALYEVYDGLPAEVVARRDASRGDFERGIALFGQGLFAAAQQAFEAVLAADPGDATARAYLERCLEWADRALPPGWDGTLAMADK